MSHESEQNFSEIQTRLAALLPTEPRRTAADAAYEAGRRDGQQAARSRLVLHRFATAAALVVAVSAGLFAALRTSELSPEPRAQMAVAPPPTTAEPERTQEASEPGGGERDLPFLRPADTAGAPRATELPAQSYFALRSAVLTRDGVQLDRLPAALAPADAGTTAPSRPRAVPTPAKLFRGGDLTIDL